MMYGYGSGSAWMVLMPILWIGLIALIVWAVVRLTRGSGSDTGHATRRDTPEEILDRRFALGEIDAEEHKKARAHLTTLHSHPR